MITQDKITAMGCAPWTDLNLHNLNVRLARRVHVTKEKLRTVEAQFLTRMEARLKPR